MPMIPHVYWLLPGPNRVTVKLLPQPGAFLTVGSNPAPLQSFSCGEPGREGTAPVRFTVLSPSGMVAAEAELVHEEPLEQPQWRTTRCHLYFKPAAMDWIWSGAAIAGDDPTILTMGIGPHDGATIAFNRPERPAPVQADNQFPCLDSFRVALLDQSDTGNMIFRGNQPLAPSPGNQLVDFDRLHDTLKLAYFIQTGRADFPEKGRYVLRDIALLDAVTERGMLLRELTSFGGADIAADLKNRAWHPASPALVSASGVRGQMSHWPIPSSGAFAPATQHIVRELAVRLRAWLLKREELPQIYYLHCSDGQERAGFTAARYLLSNHEPLGPDPLTGADISVSRWKISDLFRVVPRLLKA